jgi:MFS family permease
MVYALAFASLAPVAGSISDLVGRRYLGLSGAAMVITGLIVLGTAQRMEIGIAGMAITGAGAGIAQTISVAGISEIVPAKHRGAYLGTIYMLFFPMAPASAYGSPLNNSLGSS